MLKIVLGIIGIGAIALIVNHDQGSIFGIENNKFASLIFLGAWGAVLGSAILPRKGQYKKIASNLLIWLAIFLVLMTSHVYRYELQDIGSRLSGGLIPGSPISSRSVEGRNQITVVRLPNRQYEIDGAVNGNPVRFLVDTGASMVVLSARDAERAGINVDNLRFGTPVSTANGTTRAARITVDNISIGTIARQGFPVMVAQPGNLKHSLLGMNFIETLWGFEIRGDRLTLTDR
ncbi:MAG: TIGR02281 family clan AA aspartic protease [Rhizobiaceae bacterium]|nr:TIGR02281 family clan AA aspartic protease [Rhizobiaceae bacterium]